MPFQIDFVMFVFDSFKAFLNLFNFVQMSDR